jgi:O-acetylhomoserine/O-acetylserine sulfhydrylase-like pyridoxal-dependent enzyme
VKKQVKGRMNGKRLNTRTTSAIMSQLKKEGIIKKTLRLSVHVERVNEILSEL